MGADIIIAALELPKVDTGLSGKAELEEWLAILTGRLRRMDDDYVRSTYNEFVDPFGAYDEDEEEQETIERIRQHFIDTLNNVLYENRRDVVLLELHGGGVLISGGMSWGDSPSDSFDEVMALSMLFGNAQWKE